MDKQRKPLQANHFSLLFIQIIESGRSCSTACNMYGCLWKLLPANGEHRSFLRYGLWVCLFLRAVHLRAYSHAFPFCLKYWWHGQKTLELRAGITQVGKTSYTHV